MTNDIDALLVEAQLRSKFDGAVSEFNGLLNLVDRYTDYEEKKVEGDGDFDEDEINALEMVASDTFKVEEDLKRVRTMLGELG